MFFSEFLSTDSAQLRVVVDRWVVVRLEIHNFAEDTFPLSFITSSFNPLSKTGKKHTLYRNAPKDVVYSIHYWNEWLSDVFRTFDDVYYWGYFENKFVKIINMRIRSNNLIFRLISQIISSQNNFGPSGTSNR